MNSPKLVPVVWSSADSDELHKFLTDTPAGQKLQALLQVEPRSDRGPAATASPEHQLGAIEGWRAAVARIYELALFASAERARMEMERAQSRYPQLPPEA